MTFEVVTPAFPFGEPTGTIPILPLALVILVVLSIFIWVALVLRPARAMAFGAAAIVAVYVAAFTLNTFRPRSVMTDTGILFEQTMIGVVIACGLIELAVGSVRYLLFRRRSAGQAQVVGSVERLRFARRLAVAGALITATFPVFVGYDDIPMLDWTGALLLLTYGLAALAAMTGYILVAWELTPVKGMLFAAGSTATAWLLVHASNKLELIPITHETVLAYGMALWILTWSGMLAFVVALFRLRRQLWG